MKLVSLLVLSLVAMTLAVESRYFSMDKWNEIKNKLNNFKKAMAQDGYKMPNRFKNYKFHYRPVGNQVKKPVENPVAKPETKPEIPDDKKAPSNNGAANQGGANQCQIDFRAACISEHNKYRTMHHAPALKGSSSLHASSQSYAQTLAATNSFKHSGKSGVGENLAYSWSSSVKSLSNCADYAKKYVKMWYDEVSLYNFASGGFSGATGHFTQVVWKATTEVGCGLAISSDSKIYAVSQYTPPGNVQGRFQQNVLPK